MTRAAWRVVTRRRRCDRRGDRRAARTPLTRSSPLDPHGRCRRRPSATPTTCAERLRWCWSANGPGCDGPRPRPPRWRQSSRSTRLELDPLAAGFKGRQTVESALLLAHAGVRAGEWRERGLRARDLHRVPTPSGAHRGAHMARVPSRQGPPLGSAWRVRWRSGLGSDGIRGDRSRSRQALTHTPRPPGRPYRQPSSPTLRGAPGAAGGPPHPPMTPPLWWPCSRATEAAALTGQTLTVDGGPRSSPPEK